MRKFALALFLGFIGNVSIGQVLTIEGQYQNKNIYVSNAVASAGVGYCAYEVRVNGNITTDQVNSSAFEIDLEQFKFNSGEPVTIQILHKDGCQPKVLNPLALKPQPTFKTKEISLSATGLLAWTTTDESGSLAFEVEQYKWNKWVKVGEVQGIGTPSENKYSFQVTLTSGTNRFRVSQKGNMGKVQHSPSVEVESSLLKPTWENKGNTIELSEESQYEIFDKFGQARKRGFGKQIDLSGLQKDEYYLCYDNFVENFKKK